MDPEQAPVSIDPGESFERDYSDLDVPGFDEDDAQPAAIETAEADEPVVEKVAKEETEAEAEVDDKAKAAAEAKAAAAPGPKKVAFKGVDGKAVELLEDAVVDWKVDGKPVPVPLKELLANYSGKVAWEKRFNEVAQQRQQFADVSRSFEAERGRHKAVINEMHTAASEGRTFDAVTAMLKLSGASGSPREYIANLRNGLIKQAQELAQLTPEQRQLHEEREELAYLKAEGEQFKQQRAQEQAEKAFHGRVVKAISTANTTTEEYVSTRDWLLEQGPKVLGKEWDPKSVTPEYVASQINDIRDWKTAREALDAVDPTLVKNESTWKMAVDMLRSNRDWTAADISEIYREATQAKRSQTLSKKVAKSPTATTATASRKVSTKTSREDYSSFDEADASW